MIKEIAAMVWWNLPPEMLGHLRIGDILTKACYSHQFSHVVLFGSHIEMHRVILAAQQMDLYAILFNGHIDENLILA